jgi:hypothetical protein
MDVFVTSKDSQEQAIQKEMERMKKK